MKRLAFRRGRAQPFGHLKFGPRRAAITCFTRTSGLHCINMLKWLTPVSPATSGYTSRLCFYSRTSLFIIMSFIYAKLLVVICIAYVISEVVTHRLPLHYYEVRKMEDWQQNGRNKVAARESDICDCALQMFGADDWLAWNALAGCCCYGDETLKSTAFQSWTALTDRVVEM
jgi:hypothetical protein